MSYLSVSGFPSYTKAIISLWFRVPQETITAAAKAFTTEPPRPLFNGVVPLVIMGKKGTWFSDHGDFDLEPTYLGISCFNLDETTLISDFSANFETCIGPDINIDFQPTTVSVSTTGFPIHAEQWHHALISVDLTAQASHGWAWNDPNAGSGNVVDHYDATSRMWVAFDDVSYTKADMSADYPEGYADVHAVVCSDCSRIADTIQSVAPFEPGVPPHPDGPIPFFASGNLQCGTSPMGLPGTAEFVNNIYRVDMAEFQMWLGQSLDTDNESNRRLFIAVKKDSKTGLLEPVDPKIAAAMLGRPDILLHGSSNWIDGKNTGNLGETPPPDGLPIPSGQFTPTAKIKKFTPEPALGA
jgi:hypothetical protein